MNIDEHFNLLIKKYDLSLLYKKFIISNTLSRLLREGFYWTLLYFSNLVKEKPETLLQNSTILIVLLGLYIPSERLTSYYKSKLIEELKTGNSKYFNDKIINLSKDQILKFDLVEYYAILDHLNDNFENYIENIKTKNDIPIRFISLIIIALNKKFINLIGLFIVYYFVIRSLNENKFIKETELTQEYFNYDNIIRNYLVNSKNFLINNEFNKDYLSENLEIFNKIANSIAELNNNLDMNVNIAMFIFIIIVIWAKFHELNQFDFLYYFLIIYDVEFIGDKIMEYYKNKTQFNKMQERLNYLNSFKTIETIKNTNSIEKIIINKIINSKPKINLTKQIILSKNNPLLLDGESGSGKTSLLYILEGIIKPDYIDINPKLELINSQTYLSLPNHKSLYNGKLYDILTNYSINPDINIINKALQIAKINNKFKNNQYIDIEKLSSGEKIRLLISRIIYTVKTKSFSILLFDEIDENLNDDLAVEIWNNLKDVFNDKIILYITHNNKVKNMFNNKVFIKNGVFS